MKKQSRLLPILLIALGALGIANAQTVNWQPPAPRKAKTIFAPKPFGGNNIFKGEAEIWLSDALEELEGGVISELKDQAISSYVSQLGTNLGLYSPKPQRTFTFVVTSSDVPDAMTSGAGRIYVSLGLLKLIQSEDELAGIIAHEITHDVFAHIPKTFTRQLFWMNGTKKVTGPVDVRKNLERLLQEYEKKPMASLGEQLLGFSRFDELAADRGAFYITFKAGYNPMGLAKALKRYDAVQKDENSKMDYRFFQLYSFFLGGHPPTGQRTVALEWESNFVSMPPANSCYKSEAFDEMKKRIELLN